MSEIVDSGIAMILVGQASSSAGGEAALFWIFAALTGASALGVVVSRNIVRTAVALMFTLVGVAGLYFLLHAEFLAAAQLVVYVGGTLILIIFGVMLTSKSPFSKFTPTRVEVIVAVVLGVAMLSALVAGTRMAIVAGQLAADPATRPAGPYPVAGLGRGLLGTYLVPFELASVVLLAVMIGAAFLAKGRRKESNETEM